MQSVSVYDEYELPQIQLDLQQEGRRRVIRYKVEVEENEMVVALWASVVVDEC